MDASCRAVDSGRSIFDVWNTPRAITLAVAIVLGLSACGGGGRSRPSPPPPTNPTGPFAGGEIDVAANAVTVLPDDITGSVNLIKGGAGTLALTGTNSYSGGTLINQGTLQIGNGGVTGSIIGNVVDNGILAFNRSDDVTFDGLVSGSGGFSQAGTGSTSLTGNNTYNGATQVNSGTLYINGDQSSATGGTNVASGAMLGGSGTLGGDVNIADRAGLSPGGKGAAGNLNINGNLALSANSTLNYDMGQVVGGARINDLTNVKGNLTLDGTLFMTVAAGSELEPGAQRILNYGGALVDHNLALGFTGVGFYVQTAVNHEINLVVNQGGEFAFWDGAGVQGNGFIEGGDGVWQVGGTATPWTDAGGAANKSFNNNAFALFQGRAGTIAVSDANGTISSGGMQFATNGYTIRGDSIQLTGAYGDPAHTTIRVGDGTAAGANVTATIASSLTGASGVVKTDAGTLVLAGSNTYAGGTTINGGTLVTQNTLPGDATVNALGIFDGARLGSGTPGVTGALSNAGKVKVHGGDTQVGGNYTQTSSGTLAVSLGSMLSVAGTATLNGGTLEITGADSGYVSNTRTPVLGATGGLTGAFAQLVKDSGVVFTATTINYDAHSAWLDTTGLNVTTAAAGDGVSYTAASLNSAQRVQGAFNQLNEQIASGSSPTVSDAFMRGAGEFQQAPTLQAAQASLQSLSGQLHAASAAMTFQAIDASGRALSDHFDNVLGNRANLGVWAQNLNVGGDMGRAGYDSVSFQLNGWLVGSDRQIGTSGVAGFAFGQSQGTQQLDQSYDHNRSRTTEAMLYAGWLKGNWYTEGRVGFGQFQQDVSRQLLLGLNAEGVSAKYSGIYSVAYGETGLRLDLSGARLMPFVSVEYASIARNGFNEQGGSGFGLRAGQQTVDRWQSGAGLRASQHWTLEGGRGVDLSLGAQLRRTFASHGDAFEASFVGVQQWQPLVGIGMSRYSAAVNMHLDAALSEHTALNVAYDYDRGQRDQAQTVSARLNVAF